jgi:hydroxyacid-oxoacid transhydrogenase
MAYSADPDKHRRAGGFLAGKPIPDADESTLSNVLIQLMKDIGAPSGLRKLGYDENDIDDLVNGALSQQRQLSIAPREVSRTNSPTSSASR